MKNSILSPLNKIIARKKSERFNVVRSLFKKIFSGSHLAILKRLISAARLSWQSGHLTVPDTRPSPVSLATQVGHFYFYPV